MFPFPRNILSGTILQAGSLQYTALPFVVSCNMITALDDIGNLKHEPDADALYQNHKKKAEKP